MYWRVTPDWAGKTAFLIASGPSLIDVDLSPLKGHPVVVVNSSYLKAPWADYLVFADERWWAEQHKNHAEAIRGFKGQVVAVHASAKTQGVPLKRLKRTSPTKQLPRSPDTVPVRYTVVSAALWMLHHLGVARIVILGLDQRRDANGRCHHHAPHPWKNKPGDKSWDRHIQELKQLVEPLRDAGIEVINASPQSRIDWWPRITPEEALMNPSHESAGSGLPRSPDKLVRRRTSYTGGRARDYEARRSHEPRWQVEHDVVAAMLRAELGTAGGTVLDVPVGTGRFAQIYKDLSIDAVGVDVSPDMLAIAKTRGIDAIPGDIMALPFEDGAFLGSVCIRLANWLAAGELDVALKELARVSRQFVIVGCRTHPAPQRSRLSERRIHSPEYFGAAARAAGLIPVRAEVIDERKTGTYAIGIYGRRPAKAPDAKSVD